MEEIVLREMRASDARWLIREHGVLYRRDEGFDASFEPLVAGIVADFLKDHDPARERGWIAERDGRPVGSVFCVDGGQGMAKLRLFLILPQARGLRLGHRMLAEVLSYATARGYIGLRLWTHESHRAACALYQQYGLKIVSSQTVHSFGCELIEQTWEITF